MTDLLEAALELAAQGAAVFPLDKDKKPKIQGGFHSATTDPEIIKKWNWNGSGLIGMAIPRDHIVIDIDPRNEGDKTIKALEKLGKKLPPTKIVKTRGGGTHRYYKVPSGLRLKGKLGVGIDVKRHEKGYVVVPPSEGYTLVNHWKPTQAPEWLIDEITAPEIEEHDYVPSAPKFLAFEKGTRYGLKIFEDELEELAKVREGGRNDALNRTTFRLAQLSAGGELDEETAILRLEETALNMGLTIEETKETIKQGWSAGLKMPRQAPERQEVVTPTKIEVTEESPNTYEGFMAAQEVADDDDFYWLDWQRDEPPPPFYLAPIVPKHAYVIVYGATESSKSMVFVGLGAQASHRGMKVAVYSLENPSHIDRDRVRRLAPSPDNFRITNQYIDINDSRQLNDLVERNKPGGKGSWKDGSGTDWLIIDTYSHAFNSRSEDGNAKAIEFSRRIRYCMHVVGCSVILLDHTGYQQPGEPRDASAKRQQVDVAIFMEKIGQWSPGTPARASLTNKKSARFGNPFHYTAEIRDVRPQARGLEVCFLTAGSDKAPRWGDSNA